MLAKTYKQDTGYKYLFMKSLLITGLSGVGKTSIADLIQRKYETINKVITYTTRKPRIDEINGVHYHFITVDEYLIFVRDNQFLDKRKIFGNYYGIRKKDIEHITNKGLIPLIVVDIDGAREILKHVQCISILITFHHTHYLHPSSA